MLDHIAVINASTVVSDTDLAAMVAAVQQQVTHDFAQSWGYGATLRFVPRGTKPPKGYWQMAVLDDADQAGALGYHDVTAEGLPLGKVFAKTDLTYGYLISVTLSHEVLEMLGDPDVNLLVQDGQRATRFWAYETCDAVEADVLGYDIGGVRVSNFVLPSYFETFQPTGTKFDHVGQLSGPVPALTPGGYMAYLESGAWHQVTAQKAQNGDVGAMTREAYRARPHTGGRRDRRALPRSEWLRSTGGRTE